MHSSQEMRNHGNLRDSFGGVPGKKREERWWNYRKWFNETMMRMLKCLCNLIVFHAELVFWEEKLLGSILTIVVILGCRSIICLGPEKRQEGTDNPSKVVVLVGDVWIKIKPRNSTWLSRNLSISYPKSWGSSKSCKTRNIKRIPSFYGLDIIL